MFACKTAFTRNQPLFAQQVQLPWAVSLLILLLLWVHLPISLCQVLAKLGFASGKKINRSHIVVAKGGKVLDVQYGITPKNSVKDAITFCLAHKAEPVAGAAQPADKEAEEEAEEAAEAGEQKEKEEEQEGQEVGD